MERQSLGEMTSLRGKTYQKRTKEAEMPNGARAPWSPLFEKFKIKKIKFLKIPKKYSYTYGCTLLLYEVS